MRTSIKEFLACSFAFLALASLAHADDTHSEHFDDYLKWAKTLYLNDTLTLEVANYLDSYSTLIQSNSYALRYLEATVSSRLSVAGSDKAQVEGALSYLKKALPPATAQWGDIQQENQKANAYSGTYTWARNTMMLPDSRAKKMADFLDQYPANLTGTLQQTIQSRTAVDGIDQIDAIANHVAQSLPPVGTDPTTAVQEAYNKANIYLRTYNWARQSLSFPNDLALEVTHVVDLQPADRSSQIQSQVQVMTQQSKSRAEIEGALSDLAKYPVFELSADGKRVTGCSQRSQIDKAYKGRLPLQDCLNTNHNLKYQWANSAQTTCAVYTDTGAFIHTTDTEDCSDPIVRDMRPCLKTLEHDYRFYHYTNGAKINAYKPDGISNDDAIQKHAQIWASHAFEQHGGGNAGLYSATDPMESREYAGSGDDMYLYRLQIPAGTTYLALPGRGQNNSSCPFSPESVKKLQEAGCPTDLNHLVENEYAPMASPSCVPLVKQIFKAVHLRGWSYPFGSTSIQGCENRTTEAFVWTNLDDLPAKDIHLFRGTPPAADDPAHAEAVEIERLFNKTGRGSLWPALGDEAASSEGRSLEEIKSSLYGCENFLPQTPVANSGVSCDRQPASGLEETQATITKLKTAINKKPQKKKSQ